MPDQPFPAPVAPGGISPSVGVEIAVAVTAAALYAASRGRLTPERTQAAFRFAAKSAAGLGIFSQLTKNKGDLTGGEITDANLKVLLAHINGLTSPSNRYVTIRASGDLPTTRVPVELVPPLIDAGLIGRRGDLNRAEQPTNGQAGGARAGVRPGRVNMMRLWATDP